MASLAAHNSAERKAVLVVEEEVLVRLAMAEYPRGCGVPICRHIVGLVLLGETVTLMRFLAAGRIVAAAL